MLGKCGCCWPNVLVLALALSGSAAGSQAEQDEALKGVGITEKLQAQVPLDLEFRDEQGRTVKLSSFFSGQKPVVLTLNYAGCPMLCGLQLGGFAKSLKSLEWTAGREFEIVTVSLDPLETPELAQRMQDKMIEEYGKPEARQGWHFLRTEHEERIRKLADAVGFGYTYIPESKQYAHAAGLMLLTPEGKVSSYRYGWDFPPDVLKASLIDAGQGKTGTVLEQVVQYCFVFNSKEGRYKLAALNTLKVAGALTLVLIAGLLVWLWRAEGRKKQVA